MSKITKIDFVYNSHKKFHLLGMANMGNTKYLTNKWGELTAKAIISKLQGFKSAKYSRRYRCHYASVDVMLGGRKVRLFFCLTSEMDILRPYFPLK